MKYFIIKSNVQFPQLYNRTDDWALMIELGIGEMEEINFAHEMDDFRELVKVQDKYFQQKFPLTVEGAREFWKVANKFGMADDALDIIQSSIEIKLKKSI